MGEVYSTHHMKDGYMPNINHKCLCQENVEDA